MALSLWASSVPQLKILVCSEDNISRKIIRGNPAAFEFFQGNQRECAHLFPEIANTLNDASAKYLKYIIKLNRCIRKLNILSWHVLVHKGIDLEPRTKLCSNKNMKSNIAHPKLRLQYQTGLSTIIHNTKMPKKSLRIHKIFQILHMLPVASIRLVRKE